MLYWRCIEIGKPDFEYRDRHHGDPVQETIRILRMHSRWRFYGYLSAQASYTLEEFIKVPSDQRPSFDLESIISGIKAGLNFLHSLELVHDDINPKNTMLDDEDHTVIIGFSVCTPIGAKSYGHWQNTWVVEVENDAYRHNLLTNFIQAKYVAQGFYIFTSAGAKDRIS